MSRDLIFGDLKITDGRKIQPRHRRAHTLRVEICVGT